MHFESLFQCLLILLDLSGFIFFEPSEVKIFRKWLEKNRKEIKAEQYRSIVKQTMLLAAAQMEAARGLPHGGVSSCGDGHGLC